MTENLTRVQGRMTITLNGTKYNVCDIEDIDWDEREYSDSVDGYLDATELNVTFNDGSTEVVAVDDLDPSDYERLLQWIDPM